MTCARCYLRRRRTRGTRARGKNKRAGRYIEKRTAVACSVHEKWLDDENACRRVSWSHRTFSHSRRPRPFLSLPLFFAFSRVRRQITARAKVTGHTEIAHCEHGRRRYGVYKQYALVPPAETIRPTFTRPSAVVDRLQPRHILHWDRVRHGRERRLQLDYREYNMALSFSYGSRVETANWYTR